MQHQDMSNVTAASSLATPSTNSIDPNDDKNESLESEIPSSEELDDDQNYAIPSKQEVEQEYMKQFNAFAKKTPQTQHNDVHTFATTVKPRRTFEGSCQSTSCLLRKDIEEASTQSIRKHILMKLGMDHEPNITTYPKLTDQFREMLCKRMNISPENCLGKKSHNVEYQSDDPNEEIYENDRDVVTAEEDVQFLSFENRIYAFPSTTVKPRHKSHLVYQFTESQKTNNVVAQATLNIFVYSKRFLRSTDVQLPKNIPRLIDIEIAKVLQGSQHKLIFETFRNISIPDDGSDGDYVQVNITDLVAEWFSSHETSHGLSVKIIASRNGAALPHKIVSLDAENILTRPFIDILPRDQRKKRTKRSSLRCAKGSAESRCCRHELTVDFDKFGWDWIIAPKKYDANYCAGECKIAFMQQYAHTHVMQLSTAANPCCSPRKMTPMQLLYFDTQLNIVLGTIPNMIVEECFCS